jgi:hypothetical protein
MENAIWTRSIPTYLVFTFQNKRLKQPIFILFEDDFILS